MSSVFAAAYWWLRSPLAVSSTNYGYVATAGGGNTSASATAAVSYGVSFGLSLWLGSIGSDFGGVDGVLVDALAGRGVVLVLL